jgi:hypothetical protein
MGKVSVILLGHKSLVGKDTFFNIAEEHGFVRVAFADKLKATVADLYNFSHDQMHGNSKDVMDERYPNKADAELISSTVPGRAGPLLQPNPDFKPFLTPRRVLQIFGQDQRKLFPDIWAAYIFNVEIPKLIQAGHNKIIVTDFRFKNEANVALQFGERNTGIDLQFVKINRPSVQAKTASGDISENDLNDFEHWSHVIDNSGSLQEYSNSVMQFVSNLKV